MSPDDELKPNDAGTENANIALSTDPDVKDAVADDDVRVYPSSSEANPSPEDVRKQKEWNRKKG